jgi:triacylglycerol esterase/lipase EstA (alpha/beta hydrolase family)
MHIRTPRTLFATVAVTTLALTFAASPAFADTTNVNPPGSNDFSCKPSALHPQPVILVPGTYESMFKNWAVMSPVLKNAGYCVFSLDYGAEDGGPASGPLADSAAQLGSFVNAVLGATGAKQVDLVGHSQGGMMPRYYIKFLGGTKTVHSLVGIAPSNHGTTLTPNPLSYVPGVSTGGDGTPSTAPIPGGPTTTEMSGSVALGDFNAAASDQSAGSAFLENLNAGGDIQGDVYYTTIATTHDEIVTPYTSEALAGPADQVTNVVIQNFCPLDPIEHDQTPNDPVVQQLVLAALTNANGPLSPSFSPNCL